MTHANGNASIPGLGMTAARGLSCSVLTAGQTVTLVFEVATPSEIIPDGKIAISFPASGMPSLRAAIHQAIDAADRQRGWWPKEFSVGHPENLRNTIAISLEQPPNELTFLFNDTAAKRLAESIMSDMLGRMSAAERAKLSSGIVAPRRGLIVPGK